jgi:hypothetical protein
MNRAMATRSFADWRLPLSVPRLPASSAVPEAAAADVEAVVGTVVGGVIGESDPSLRHRHGCCTDGIARTPTFP